MLPKNHVPMTVSIRYLLLTLRPFVPSYIVIGECSLQLAGDRKKNK